MSLCGGPVCLPILPCKNETRVPHIADEIVQSTCSYRRIEKSRLPNGVTALFLDSLIMGLQEGLKHCIDLLVSVRRQRMDQEALQRALNGARHVIIKRDPDGGDQHGDYGKQCN